MNKFYLYILKCSDDSYYVGHTDDIDKRMCEHYNGETPCYTQNRRPFKIMKTEEFPTRYEALSAERKIKNGREPKRRLILKEIGIGFLIYAAEEKEILFGKTLRDALPLAKLEVQLLRANGEGKMFNIILNNTSYN